MLYQRVRDPLHDLIQFDDSDFETALWGVVCTGAFQRLRRVRQLGFSDQVYPGATHSRFIHSLGVFHTARNLMKVIRERPSEYVPAREALTAALVHDVGHGPFSHAFEDVGRRLNLKLAEHEAMSDALVRNGEIADVLSREFGRGFADNVANILGKGGVTRIEHAVVSSQFDADRLDYIRRDRLMTGTQHAAIDFGWLIANLEVGRVRTGVDDQELGEIDTFVLGPKAVFAAEAFVLGLFQLYPTVYFHKTTRGIEKIFSELLIRIVNLVRDGKFKLTGLAKNHPIIHFALNPDSIEAALAMDDTVIWGALPLMVDSKDVVVAELSHSLRNREIFKCYDVRVRVAADLDPTNSETDELIERIDRCCATIAAKLNEWSADHMGELPRLLLDQAERSPYKPVGESKGPLDLIHIRVGDKLMDIRQRSSVVRALKTFKLLRVYRKRDDSDANTAIEDIVKGEIESCVQMRNG